ncbi:MAG: DNRLRE domain-containing protein, partial [Anaerolineae bacterium]
AVQSAKLRLYLIGSWEFPGWIDRVTAYQAAQSWTEMGATWNSKPGMGSAYGIVDVPPYNSPGGWYELDVTTLVQGWVNGSIPNYGIIIRGDETPGDTSSWRSFSTREGPYPPQLVVRYAASSLSAPVEGTPEPAAGAGGYLLQELMLDEEHAGGRSLNYLGQ